MQNPQDSVTKIVLQALENLVMLYASQMGQDDADSEEEDELIDMGDDDDKEDERIDIEEMEITEQMIDMHQQEKQNTALKEFKELFTGGEKDINKLRSIDFITAMEESFGIRTEQLDFLEVWLNIDKKGPTQDYDR
eukprot:UN29196